MTSTIGSCLQFFGPADATICTDYSGSGWTVENCADCFRALLENDASVGRTFNVVDEFELTAWQYMGETVRRGVLAALALPPLPGHVVPPGVGQRGAELGRSEEPLLRALGQASQDHVLEQLRYGRIQLARRHDQMVYVRIADVALGVGVDEAQGGRPPQAQGLPELPPVAGQIEVDEVYVGEDSRGKQFVITISRPASKCRPVVLRHVTIG